MLQLISNRHNDAKGTLAYLLSFVSTGCPAGRRRSGCSCRCATQAQTEAEAERGAEEGGGNSGAAGAAAGGGEHAGGDGQGEEEALLQQSSPSDGGTAHGLERWRGKVALVTGSFCAQHLALDSAQSLPSPQT